MRLEYVAFLPPNLTVCSCEACFVTSSRCSIVVWYKLCDRRVIVFICVFWCFDGHIMCEISTSHRIQKNCKRAGGSDWSPQGFRGGALMEIWGRESSKAVSLKHIWNHSFASSRDVSLDLLQLSEQHQHYIGSFTLMSWFPLFVNPNTGPTSRWPEKMWTFGKLISHFISDWSLLFPYYLEIAWLHSSENGYFQQIFAVKCHVWSHWEISMYFFICWNFFYLITSVRKLLRG